MRKLLCWLILVSGSAGLTAQQVVNIDRSSSGKVFEGIGALSAGASSRLLIDYPAGTRKEILDWLFLPGYGASFHHLKTEIGGDVNSTDGTEPSYAHTREEFDHPQKEFFLRGYESWLMCEAKKRNPSVYLDILQWGAPGWIGNGEFFSQDNADYIVRYIEKNKEYFGLDINYCGIWNERQYALESPRNSEWIKLLSKEIHAHRLNTQVVASDEVGALTVGHEMMKDPQLLDAVDVLGTHYQDGNPKNFDSQIVKLINKPVWSSEDGPWRGDWAGAASLARKFNRNYLLFGMTKTIIWSLVTAYYDILPIAGSGIMKANTPWSGQYEVKPALWAVAHFTHFAQPGWRYLDSGCGFSADSTSSFTTLISPDGNDLSFILETAVAKSDLVLDIIVPLEFSKREFYIRESDSVRQFVALRKVSHSRGRINYTFRKGCIYSLTTVNQTNTPATPAQLTGQSFPLPYSDDFETTKPEALPKYTQDQSGVFEVQQAGVNKILSQVVPGKGIEWHFRLNPDPVTILGDSLLADYSIAIDVKLNDSNDYAAVYGRVIQVVQLNTEPPHSYWFRVRGDGGWQLGKTGPVIKQGTISIQKSWPLLQLSFNDHTRNVVRFSAADLSRMSPMIRNLFPELKAVLSGETDPDSVSLVVYRDGNYYFCREIILKSGQSKLNPLAWNNLKLSMKGSLLSGYINGRVEASATDSQYSRGLAGFGCGWHLAAFDNLRIDPVN